MCGDYCSKGFDTEKQIKREQLGEMDLDKEADERTLTEFLKRVTDGRRTSPREARRVFRDMLDKMTVDEMKLNFSALVAIFVRIDNDPNDDYVDYDINKSIFQKILQTTEKDFGPDHSSYCVELVKTYNKLSLDGFWTDGSVRYFASGSDVEYILWCCSIERSDGAGMRSSNFLMQALADNDEDIPKMSHLLLYYGFPYSFDQDYFQQVSSNTSFNFQVKGTEIYSPFSTDISKKGNLRLQMAVEILGVLFQYIPARQTYDTIELDLKLLWNSVPFPFISSSEMFKLMEPFYKGTVHSLEDVCEEYVNRNTIFSVPEMPQPRCLKHLARVQVRKNLIEANTISDDAIDALELPNLLKSYVKLEYLLPDSTTEKLSSNNVVFEDPDFPMIDEDDECIAEMEEFCECSQDVIDSSGTFRELPIDYEIEDHSDPNSYTFYDFGRPAYEDYD